MAFRRSYEKLEQGNIKRRAIMLTAIVFVLAFFVQAWLGNWITPKPIEGNEVSVHFLSDTTYLIETDTTNYDQFASMLRKAIVQAKQQHEENYINIVIPKSKRVGSIADIVLVANAMDVKVELTTEP
ncbi:MAG: hypothetical protein GY810_23560 [Aureispira sp.]|nr:hypothetical protein [Aureispira sp.]